MFYKDNDHNAMLAMEYSRTGGYGDYYEERRTFSCPRCGAREPDVFFVSDDEECVGCSECVCAADTPWG